MQYANNSYYVIIINSVSCFSWFWLTVIFVRGNNDSDAEEEVVGLTTGAILFCLSSVGIAVGLGYYPLVVVSTLLILVNVSIARLFKKHVYNNESKSSE